MLLAVTAEEKGLIGSTTSPTTSTVSKAGIAADVNLDMPVPLYDFQDVIAFGADRSSIGPAVAARRRPRRHRAVGGPDAAKKACSPARTTTASSSRACRRCS